MDASELRDQLISVLKWDGVVADGVTAAISGASSREEIDQIVKDYIGSEQEARKAVEKFANAKFPAPTVKQRPAVAKPLPAVPQVTDEDLKASVFMGVNVKTKVKRNSKQQQQQGSSAPVLERKVVNCLECGKIFDCRRPGGDAMKFLAAGGICTFCGNRVKLVYTDGSSNLDQEEEEMDVDEKPSACQQQAEAEALRDRLVEFDRQAAKRTTVIDDQSDYFAIDSNAWLSEEERMELKRREQQAAEAAEAARKRITVTVDLLGRRVIMDNNGEASGSGAGDGDAVAAAMAATAAERPQGGGAAALGPQQAQRPDEERIQVNPSMAAAHYTFIPKASAGGGGGKEGEREKQRQKKAGKSGGLMRGVARLQHDDPFELAARELAELLKA